MSLFSATVPLCDGEQYGDCPDSFFRVYNKCYHVPEGYSYDYSYGQRYCEGMGAKIAEPTTNINNFIKGLKERNPQLESSKSNAVLNS